MREVRVLLVDDHRVFTELLGFALDAAEGVRCVARARTVGAALEVATTAEFDAAILDVQLPDGDGITLGRRLRELRPNARILALTAFPTADLAAKAARAGMPLLAKDGSFDAILRALRDSETDAATASDPAVPTLTAREREVLELLAEGLDVQSIARSLSISVHTARGHVKMLLHKTGARSQLEAVVSAQRAGLLPAPA